MLAAVALSIAFHSGPAKFQTNQASQLISKMLKTYSDATSMTGTITMSASDGKGTVQLLTTLAYQKPSLLYIHQKKMGGAPRQWLTISNGKWFSYNTPDGLGGGEDRLTESVSQIVPDEYVRDAKGKRMPKMKDFDIRQIYAIGAQTLGDRSIPLDIAIGRREDLEHDNLTWVTTQYQGKGKVGDADVNIISGRWRPYGDGRLITNIQSERSTYEMAITDEGKLLRYTVFQPIDNGPTLTMVWDVNLEINGKPDAKIFTGKS